MKIKIEHTFPRHDEIILYYTINGIKDFRTAAYELNEWFKGTEYKAGFGGHHVWLAKDNERVMIISED